MPSSWDNYGDGPSFQSLLSAFRNADAGTGLAYDEFQSLLGNLALSGEQLATLAQASDLNANGRITYAEFVPLAVGKPVSKTIDAVSASGNINLVNEDLQQLHDDYEKLHEIVGKGLFYVNGTAPSA